MFSINKHDDESLIFIMSYKNNEELTSVDVWNVVVYWASVNAHTHTHLKIDFFSLIWNFDFTPTTTTTKNYNDDNGI